MSAKVTPAEAKAVWDSLEEPSCRKVADKFAAAGRPISFKTVNEWRNKGWGSKTAEQIEASASNAVEKINVALPAITGDVTSTLGGKLESPSVEAAPVPHQGPALPDTRSSVERAEDALLKAITGATTVWDGIRDLMAGTVPEGKVIPPMMLAAQPEGIAKLMLAASAAITSAIEDSKQLPFLRAEAAAAIPGTQTVYAPGQGPHAGEGDYPLRSAMEAFDAALKGIRERKTA